MHTGLELPSQILQEHAHGWCIRPRQSVGERLVRTGPAGGEQIKALEPLVGEPGRAHPALVPAVAGPTLLANSGRILAPELDLSAWMRLDDRGEFRPKPIFQMVESGALERSAALPWGCRGLVFWRESPSRCSSRDMPHLL